MSEKIKIGIFFPKDSEALFNINSTSTFGGASVQMYGIAKELSRRPDILALSIIPEYSEINFPDSELFRLVPLYKRTDSPFVKFLHFMTFLIKYRPHILIQHGLMFESCVLSMLCRLIRIKFVFMFAHDIEIQGLGQTSQKKIRLFRTLLKKTPVIITQNQYQHDRLLSEWNKPSHIIYNGFEIPGFFEKKAENRIILWVARCDSWKRPELFISLAQENPDLKFVMICPKSHEDELFSTVKKQAGNLSNLKFLDFVPLSEINVWFRDAALFINTSDTEGFPQTFIQATMNCTPILSLTVNPDEVLSDEEKGFCCKGDMNLLNQHLRKLMTDEKMYALFSRNAWNYASEKHDICKNVSKILELR